MGDGPFPQIGPGRPVLTATPDLLKKEVLNWLPCTKGVEVSSKDSSSKGYSEGAYQLSFAALHIAIGHFKQLTYTSSFGSYPRVVTPVLVTTATLRILNAEARLEQVREATTWDDVSKTATALFVRNIPCEDQRLTAEKLVNERLTDTMRIRLSGSGKANEFKNQLFWDQFTSSFPPYIAVLSYEDLPRTLRQLIGRPIHEELSDETKVLQG